MFDALRPGRRAARRARDLERYHRRTAERVAQGPCPKCGNQPPVPGQQLCKPCNEKTNRASRARDARLRAAEMPRRDRERAREYERDSSRREVEARRDARLCTKCGQAPAVEGRGPVDSRVRVSISSSPGTRTVTRFRKSATCPEITPPGGFDIRTAFGMLTEPDYFQNCYFKCA